MTTRWSRECELNASGADRGAAGLTAVVRNPSRPDPLPKPQEATSQGLALPASICSLMNAPQLKYEMPYATVCRIV